MALRLLVIDDSSIARKVLIRSLRMAHLGEIEILEAQNGAEGLDVLRGSWVDLVFLDINMPVMNGFRFMEELRADPVFADTPVIVVSTEGSEERKEVLEKMKIEAFVRKPASPELLTSTVNQVLQRVSCKADQKS